MIKIKIKKNTKITKIKLIRKLLVEIVSVQKPVIRNKNVQKK
jgi:hypothetical protein